ncbi:Hypothetical protein BROD_2732 [Brucella sp. NF 2653]|nr:Hypothetical protein BROD_2732 [Brucella sp. NF 2653]
MPEIDALLNRFPLLGDMLYARPEETNQLGM